LSKFELKSETRLYEGEIASNRAKERCGESVLLVYTHCPSRWESEVYVMF